MSSRLVVCLVFFFFKQKTAYDMRISDWSSDVCSSDLHAELHRFQPPARSRISDRREGDLLRPDGIYRAQRALGGRRHRVRHRRRRYLAAWQQADRRETRRSEEHTSELQSLMRISYAVFCLKKKKKKKPNQRKKST